MRRIVKSVDDSNLLGEYLRVRRGRLQPADVGLPDFGTRRTPGLRRQELAQLAGISSDYYVRLEQGRDQHPSAQVLDALARALQLDEQETVHLHELARPSRRRRTATPTERVAPGLVQLITTWHQTPAVVQGRLGEVLAANPLAVALSPMYTPGNNPLKTVFLDPEVQALYGDGWVTLTESAVASLRALAGADLNDPALVELVGELSLGSARFRELWARHDVRVRAATGIRRLKHPQVGPIELRYEKLVVAGTNQTLVIYHAEPGSASEQALSLLQTLAADLIPPPTASRDESRSQTQQHLDRTR